MTTADIAAALSAPFPADAVKFRPQNVKGNRALALPYIDARMVMDRLDAVLGIGGWQTESTVLNDGSVVCRLSAKIGDEWVVRTDVGGMSEQPDGGDRMKAAFSDALKRAAVQLGVGRYLYALPQLWADYDPARKQFTRQPALPAWASPGQRVDARAAERFAAHALALAAVTTPDGLAAAVAGVQDDAKAMGEPLLKALRGIHTEAKGRVGQQRVLPAKQPEGQA